MKVLVTKAAANPCDHVHIKTLAGKLLDNFTIAELKQAIEDDETGLLKRMLKYIVKKANATTLAQMKTAIEAEDF